MDRISINIAGSLSALDQQISTILSDNTFIDGYGLV